MRGALSGARDWFQRAAQQIDGRDLWQLTPAGVLGTLLGSALSRGRAPLPDGDVSLRDPAFVGLAVDLFRALGERYFRFQVEGVAHVPPTGPALLVGNHNGGPIPTDTFLTLVAIWDHLGPQRAVHPLAHDLLFYNPMTRKYAQRLGVLRASQGSAAGALRAGHLALVYPGSDLDGNRPFSQRHLVELGGRSGFLRLALREKVPIIPVVSVGTHEQFIVISRGDSIGRLLRRSRRFRFSIFPIVLSLPFGLTSGFFPYLPLPAQTTLRFGPSLRWPELGPGAAEDPVVLSRCYRQVEAAMQRLLDELSDGRVPFFGKRNRAGT